MAVVPVRDSDGQPIPHLFQIGGQNAPVDPASLEPLVLAHPAPAPSVAKAVSAPAQTAKSILSQLRARLRVVEREIKARKALEEERDAIKRLIHAAKSDRDNVRRIRSAG